MPERAISNECPFCQAPMIVSAMACTGCGVDVRGAFAMTRLGSLPVDHQRFIEMFVLAGGSLKEIAQQTGVSYPTVRSRLDKVIDALRDEIAKRQATKGRGTKGTLLDAVGPAKPADAALEAARLIKDL